MRVADPGSSDGIEYVDDQFILCELVWENGELVEKNPQNISDNINLSADKRSFTYSFGNLDEKSYILHYRSTYKQGLLLQNKVELKSDGEGNKVSYGQFVDAQSGGGIHGDLNSKIKIVKVAADNEDIGLENAKFKITRKASGATFNLVTDSNGEAVSIQLIPGEYEIEEIEAPDKYLLNNTKYTVNVVSNQPVTQKITTGDSVILQLKVKGSGTQAQTSNVVDECELSANNNWNHTFKNLRKYDAETGEEIEYVVEEKNVPQGYEVSYEKDPTTGAWIVTNTQTKIDITVTKEWKDNTGSMMPSPVAKIEVELYKDGNPTGTILELNAGNNWSGSFKNLEVANGPGSTDHYQYSVKEVGEVDNSIQLVGKWYGVSYGGTMEDGLTITNKEKVAWTPMEPPTRDIKVTKEWKDIQGKDIEAPVEKIEVELYKNGVATGNKLELTKDNNWTGVFEKLEVADGLGSTDYYQYTVKEVGESGSAIQISGKWYGVVYDGTMKDGLTVTNKEKMQTPSKSISNTSTTHIVPKTGDGSNLFLYALLILISVTLLILISRRFRKR